MTHMPPSARLDRSGAVRPGAEPGSAALRATAPVPEAPAPADPYRAALRTLRRPLVAVVAFSAVVNVLMLTGSVYMLQVYDRVLASGSVPTLVTLFGIVCVLFGFLCLYDILRRRLLARAAMRLDGAAGDATFGLWLRAGLPAAAAARGDARAMRDLETVRGFASGGAIVALFDLPFVPVFLAVLFILHPWLGWLTLAGAGVSMIVAAISRHIGRAPLQSAAEAEAAERDFSEAGRQAAEAIAAMGMARAVGRRWRALHNGTLAAHQAAGDPSESLAAFSRSFRMLLQSGILSLGAYLVITGEISAGMIIASSVLSGRALAPLDQVIGQWRAIGRAHQAHRRLKSVFADRATEASEAIALPDPQGRIEVAGLTKLFPGRVGEDRPPILDAVGFSLEPGDGLGVIGASGSGKSTLGRLLTGAWEADSGEVRLDGATLDQWTPERLGRLIGYLPQRVELLPGTIRNNICRFDPDATDEAVINAAERGGLHDMILRLPDGYATRVGDASGVTLSGGQVQRLGLARALYGAPKLVVLDEPNANLDAAGDAALGAAVADLRDAGAVVVVMAHRPSALAAVNKILVMENGRVARFGDRDEILGRAVKLPGTAEAAPRPKRRLPLRIVTPGQASRPADGDPVPAGGIAPDRGPVAPAAAQAPAAQAAAPTAARAPAMTPTHDLDHDLGRHRAQDPVGAWAEDGAADRAGVPAGAMEPSARERLQRLTAAEHSMRRASPVAPLLNRTAR